MKNHQVKKRGFTLLELIIVIAILSILVAVLIPTVSGYIDKANIATDTANLRTLNSISQLYRLESNPITEEIFAGLGTDSSRMNALISDGYLNEAIIPKQKDKTFTWNTGVQQWLLSNSKIPTTLTGVTMATGGHTGYLKGTYIGIVKDMVMPLTLDGINITHVYQDVFSDAGLTSLSFDPTTKITQIHARAFKNNNLTEVTIPVSVKYLDYGAFLNNPITKIIISAGVTFQENVFTTNVFRDVYIAQGAGTYLYINKVWVKQ